MLYRARLVLEPASAKLDDAVLSRERNTLVLAQTAPAVQHMRPFEYSVCSLVVPRLEEAILTPVLKKNFKRPSILGQEGHSYSQKHSNLSYDQFGGGLEQSDTAPLLLPPWLEEY